MAAQMRTLYFAAAVSIFFFLLFFLAYSQRSQSGDVYRTSTHDVALAQI